MRSALALWTLGYLIGVVLGDALGCGVPLGRVLSFSALAGLLWAAWRRGPWAHMLPLVAAALGSWAQAATLPTRSQPTPVSPARTQPGLDPSRPSDLWLLEGQVCGDVRTTAAGVQLRLVPQALQPLVTASAAQVAPAETPLPTGAPSPFVLRLLGSLAEPIWPGDRLRLALPLRSLQSLAAGEGRFRRGSSHEPAGLSVFGDAVLRVADAQQGATTAQQGAAPTHTTKSDCLQARFLLRHLVKARQVLLRAWVRSWTQLPAWVRGTDGHAASAFVQAITLGERSALRRLDSLRASRGQGALETQLKEAGVYHILSVSGLHMSAVGLVFFALASLLARRLQGSLAHTGWATTQIAQRWAALATLPVVLAYTLISGAEPPAVRAALALALFLLGQLCCRRARLREGLAIAILWAGLPIAPESSAQRLFSPSLVLSFVATIGIAYLRPLSALLPRRWFPAKGGSATSGKPPASRVLRACRALSQALLQLLDASLAALLCTAPLLAYYFAELQGGSLLGNFAITPIAELVTLPAGLLAALAAALWPPLSLPFAVLATLSARLVLFLAQLLSGLGLSRHVPAPCLGVVAIWFLGLGLWRWRPRYGLALLALAVGAQVLLTAWPSETLRLTFLDVGQGDAAVAELPSGEVLVFDAGRPGQRIPASDQTTGAEPAMVPASTDSGQAVVAPFLRRRGHRRIDLLIVSHRHPDHMGGVLSLLRQFDVDILWLTRPADGPSTDPAADALAQAERAVIDLARERGTLVAAPHSHTLSGVRVDVLSPCPTLVRCRAQARGDWHENDNSLVIALRYRGRSVLMTGDIEAAAEAALCQQQPTLRADILKLPHHGSRTSSSDLLLDTVQPRLAIASLGFHNRFGFPHPEPLARLRHRQVPLVRTDQEGAIQIAIDARGTWSVSTQAAAPPWSAWLPERWLH